MPNGFRGAAATTYLRGVEASFNAASEVVNAVAVSSGVHPSHPVRLPHTAAEGRFVAGAAPGGNMILCDQNYVGAYQHHLRMFGGHFGQQFQVLLATGDDIAVNDLGLPDASAAVQLVHELLRGLAMPVSNLFGSFEDAVSRLAGRMMAIGGGGDDGLEYEAGQAESCRAECRAAMLGLDGIAQTMIEDIEAQIAIRNAGITSQQSILSRTPSLPALPTAADIAADQRARTNATSAISGLQGEITLLRADIAKLQEASTNLITQGTAHNTTFDTLTAEITQTDREFSAELNYLADEMDGYLRQMKQIRDSFNPEHGIVNLAGILQLISTLPPQRQTQLQQLKADVFANYFHNLLNPDGTPNWENIEALLRRLEPPVTDEELASLVQAALTMIDGHANPDIEQWDRLLSLFATEYSHTMVFPVLQLNSELLERFSRQLATILLPEMSMGGDEQRLNNAFQLLQITELLRAVGDRPFTTVDPDGDGFMLIPRTFGDPPILCPRTGLPMVGIGVNFIVLKEAHPGWFERNLEVRTILVPPMLGDGDSARVLWPEMDGRGWFDFPDAGRSSAFVSGVLGPLALGLALGLLPGPGLIGDLIDAGISTIEVFSPNGQNADQRNRSHNALMNMIDRWGLRYSIVLCDTNGTRVYIMPGGDMEGNVRELNNHLADGLDLGSIRNNFRNQYGISIPDFDLPVGPEDIVANPEFFAVLINFFETRTTNTL